MMLTTFKQWIENRFWWPLPWIFVLFVVLVLLGPHRLELSGTVCAAMVVVIGLYPLALFLNSPQPLPFFGVIGGFYTLYFGIAALLVDVAWPPDEPIILYLLAPKLWEIPWQAMAAILTGTMALLGVGLVASHFLRQILPVLPLAPTKYEPKAYWIAAAALAFHFLAMLVPEIRSFPSVGQMVVPLGNFGFGIILLLVLRDWPNSKKGLALFIALLVLRIGIGGTTGSMAGIMLLPAFLGFLIFAANRHAGLILITLTCLIVAFGYGPLNIYRASITSESAVTQITPERYVQLFLSIPERLQARDNYSETSIQRCRSNLAGRFSEDSEQFESCVKTELDGYVPVTKEATPLYFAALRQGIKRVQQAALFSLVYERTPAQVPYWQGETLKPLGLGFIPRALWPSKPEERSGKAFGLRYDLITAAEGDMSVNLSWLIESYANFGWIGIITIMSAAGLFLAFLDASLNRPNTGIVQLAAGATILFPMLNHESNISLTIGLTFPLIIFLALFIRIIGWTIGHATAKEE